MLTKQQIYDKINELRESQEDANEASLAFINWLSKNTEIAVLLGQDYDGYADGFPVFFDYTCSQCEKVIDGEDAEEEYENCPYCGKPIPFYGSEIYQLFDGDLPEDLDEIVTDIQLFSADNATAVLIPEEAVPSKEDEPGSHAITGVNLQNMFSDFLCGIDCTWYGDAKFGSVLEPMQNKNQFIETDVFLLRPYNQEECSGPDPKPNFVYKPEDIRIWWDRYPLNSAYSNKKLGENKMREILTECQKSVERIKGEE